jgi:hypothetical protein
MEPIEYDTPEINNKDLKEFNKIIEEIYSYLYELVKKDIKENICNNNNNE